MINFGKNVLKTKQLKTREIYIYIYPSLNVKNGTQTLPWCITINKKCQQSNVI